MELGTQSPGALLLSGILGMYAIIPTSQLWMTYNVKDLKRENIMRLGYIFNIVSGKYYFRVHISQCFKLLKNKKNSRCLSNKILKLYH